VSFQRCVLRALAELAKGRRKKQHAESDRLVIVSREQVVHQKRDIQKHARAGAAAYRTDDENAGLGAVDDIRKLTADFRMVQRVHGSFDMRSNILSAPEIGDVTHESPHACTGGDGKRRKIVGQPAKLVPLAELHHVGRRDDRIAQVQEFVVLKEWVRAVSSLVGRVDPQDLNVFLFLVVILAVVSLELSQQVYSGSAKANEQCTVKHGAPSVRKI